MFAKKKEVIEKCIAVKMKQNIFGNIFMYFSGVFL
ncbi:hypothetical protein M5D96_004814 [Drosophila gunungcola]|uniref:Uncharacterized protein n=1 Tax=Drosophila gunungcola TaxID=103775 RepID=A0A9P9YUT6_9MUSC|nr:hypothetical protein M5D96_004814 [Drosophila gunungcola]